VVAKPPTGTWSVPQLPLSNKVWRFCLICIYFGVENPEEHYVDSNLDTLHTTIGPLLYFPSLPIERCPGIETSNGAFAPLSRPLELGQPLGNHIGRLPELVQLSADGSRNNKNLHLGWIQS
jgi:hypothetical protein